MSYVHDLFLRLCHQGLAAFLKAIGYLIPLMDAEYANYYTREVMLILIREFQSPDEEMKKIVLKVRLSECWVFSLCSPNHASINLRQPPATHSRLFDHHMVASGLVVR